MEREPVAGNVVKVLGKFNDEVDDVLIEPDGGRPLECDRCYGIVVCQIVERDSCGEERAQQLCASCAEYVDRIYKDGHNNQWVEVVAVESYVPARIEDAICQLKEWANSSAYPLDAYSECSHEALELCIALLSPRGSGS